MAQPAVALKNPFRAAFLAWLVPGLGHLYQGRTGKGLLYAVCILGLYFTGLILGDGQVVYWRWINPLKDAENFRFSYLCQFFVGLAALPALVQEVLRSLAPDLGPILGGLLAGPIDAVGENAAKAVHPRLGKLVEIGLIYTMMAGLLNILAIYDAFDGPAYAAEDAVADAEAANAARAGLAGAEGIPGMNIYAFALPLILAISLVYAASRHESWPRIWSHAARLSATILGILLAAMAVLLLVNSQI